MLPSSLGVYGKRLAENPQGAASQDRRKPYAPGANVVGDRIRRLRLERGLRLVDVARRVRRPEGTHYSGGYVSRVERGWANAPLYVYLQIATVLEVDQWRLFAADDVFREFRMEEIVLLRFLRRVGIAPEEALARVIEAPSR